MVTDYQKIKSAIENALVEGKKNFIIYPFGEYGTLTKQILNDSFGVEESYIMDNKLSKFNPKIKGLEYCKELDCSKYIVLFTCANPDVQEEVLGNVKLYFRESNIVNIFPKFPKCDKEKGTICGKYSYGSLCDHWLVESVGAFCSFAIGVDAVENHATQYISVHPFLYRSAECNKILKDYDYYKDAGWYFPGVRPHGYVAKLSKSKIGNDVWLGRNVIITNGANIGNGVIAGAGAVITRDVPDYAVVAGVPAKIIRYRYTEEQIKALNDIAWWDWSDEKIRECYDDFYLDVDTFIDKHKK